MKRGSLNVTCDAKVHELPGLWHWHRCDRPDKAERTDRDGKVHPVCGIHARSRTVWHVDGSVSKLERKKL